MSSEKTYTLGEVGTIAVLSPLILGLMLILAVPFALWQAYVGAILWNWFPAVYFHLQPISIWMILGFVYVRGVFVQTASYKNHELDTQKNLLGLALSPAFALLVGYLVHHFAM